VILYGRNPVREALRGRRAAAVRGVWACAGAAREPWLSGIDVQVCSAEEVERRCGSSAHQGVCGEAGAYPYADAQDLLEAESPLIVVLDQVQDPQNLGSICRTAECAGANGLVIPERRSAEVTPAACKASAGAIEHLPIARVRNVADFLIDARDAGCWIYGASVPPGADDRPQLHTAQRVARVQDVSGAGASSGRGTRTGGSSVVSYSAPDYRGGVVLVLGSEGRGLRPRVVSQCDQLVSLPVHGQIESLGVAAAAAALLYGILQARETALDNSP
jgi:23S rRNA (guanosine2251-2'-O)-methyltransferase